MVGHAPLLAKWRVAFVSNCLPKGRVSFWVHIIQQALDCFTFPTLHSPCALLCCTVQFFFAFNYSKAGRSPAGLSLNLASQAWTSVLAWYTGHLVCGLRHSGACLARWLSQLYWLAKPGPVSLLGTQVTWFVVSGTRWCPHSWGSVNVTQACGILLPSSCCQICQPAYATLSIGRFYTLQLGGIIRLIINLRVE